MDEHRGIYVQLENTEETPEIRHTSTSVLYNTHIYYNFLYLFKCKHKRTHYNFLYLFKCKYKHTHYNFLYLFKRKILPSYSKWQTVIRL